MNRLPLHVLTIVLDGQPWLPCIYTDLMRLVEIPWTWTVVEGAAMNVKDTAWCAPQKPRLSRDGTTAFLRSIAHHPRIRVIQREQWDGKVEQCNAALATIATPGVLLQQDADERWTVDQLRTIVELFEDDTALGSAAFNCRYMVGPNLRTVDDASDWWRAWRFAPGDLFLTHEPPRLSVQRGRSASRHETSRHGLIFDHFSYVMPEQVAFKEQYYGKAYRGALDGWERLQRHQHFPTKIKPFFPWSAPGTVVDRVFKS